MPHIRSTSIATCLLIVAGCTSSTPTARDGAGGQSTTTATTDDTEATSGMFGVEGPLVTIIEPGPDALSQAQEALILAEAGDVIEFAAGKFEFNGTLSLDGVRDVTIRGKGIEQTTLNFANLQAGKGGEGLKIKADNFTIEDLTIEDTPGDAIKLQECNGLTMRRVRTWWTKGPDASNGAYGLYPVMSTNVLIEHCVAECASDAGIYVGQSRQVVVRHCRVERNVAGIEIENCLSADVYENAATNNTGGILVFSLPGLTLKNGSDCRVFKNEVSENNHSNFAKEGAMVATVPPGSGLMIMANDRVEVFDNNFVGNASAHCLIVSFLITQRKFDDAGYDPYPEAIHIHDNTFSAGGTDPQGEYFTMYTAMAGKPLPDIVFDGVVDAAKLVNGKLPPDQSFSIVDNGEATFVNLDLSKLLAGAVPNVSTNLEPFSGSLPRVGAVVIPGVE
ncbi:MAG: right-handed parallel beta-helix repeat-containing protein [Planctomycetaceae bacterium]|nr:right-handed parallel beta-helix repeat-containing protein [Planctomycetales bacterium]MCB9921886.1 right-handed parallel beta-helix repeat-containing protein [Planctomycetaceae bacterium]